MTLARVIPIGTRGERELVSHRGSTPHPKELQYSVALRFLRELRGEKGLMPRTYRVTGGLST